MKKNIWINLGIGLAMAGWLAVAPGMAATTIEKEASLLFGDAPGTLVVYDSAADHSIVYGAQRSAERITSFSTFKIPNSLIALETGVVADTDQVIQVDPEQYPPQPDWPEAWKGKHNLRTAFRFSVVPVYRAIAKRIGAKRMKDYLRKFAYGNMDDSSGLDQFWLNGSLKISAMEQIAFLKKFHEQKLPVRPETVRAVKEIMIQETTPAYTLSAKTGGGMLDHGRALGWYVGYVERGPAVYYFALNMEGRELVAVQKERVAIVKKVLGELKLID